MEKKYLELAENLFYNYSAQKFSDILKGLNAEEIVLFSKAYCIAAENYLKKVREKVDESVEKTRRSEERTRRILEEYRKKEEENRKVLDNRDSIESKITKSEMIIGLFPIGEA